MVVLWSTGEEEEEEDGQEKSSKEPGTTVLGFVEKIPSRCCESG